MNTSPLPIRATPGISPQLESTAAPANPDAGQFSAALSREMTQRQEAQAPQPPAKASEPARPAPPADKAGEAAKPAQGTSDDATDKTVDASDASQDEDAAEHPAAAQVTDMLALVASLNLAPQASPAAPASQGTNTPADTPADTLADTPVRGQADATVGARTKGPARDSTTLAAKHFAPPGQPTTPASAATTATTSGATSAADRKAPVGQGFELRAGTETLPDKFKALSAVAQAAQERAALEAGTQKELAPVATVLAQVAPLAAQAAGVAADHLPARVGSPAWDQQVGQKIVWMVAGEEQSASLTLNPPDLGPLKVVLSVTNDQAHVAFSANQMEVRQALENALPRLREMMSESGIALGNATVDAGQPDQRQAQDDGSRTKGGAGTHHDGTAGLDEAAARPVRVSTIGARGAVDTFA